jgi:acetamidase/formamidase
MRAAYGFISNRHGLGALPGEFPEDGESLATRAVDTIVTAGTVSHFATVEHRGGAAFGRLDAGGGRALGFPLAPFLGLMGVAAATDEPVHSVPPGAFGGNIDIKHITAGARMYLPVQVDGGLFYTGDPHFAQGNGEVALTAFEAPLRATLRLSVLTGPDAAAAVGRLRVPVVETATHWIPTGMDVDLNAAMRHAVRNAIDFLDSRLGVPRPVALAYLSAAADFEVTQVVDSVKGIHCMIRKADFAAWG